MSKSPRYTHGPIVKSGPTAGKNRSRTKSGAWRKKRSDTGKSRSTGKKGCYITTAACSYMGLSDDCSQLTTLRSFRDGFMAETPERAELVQKYYRTAPRLVHLLDDEQVAAEVWDRIRGVISLIESGASQEALSGYRTMVEFLERTLQAEQVQTGNISRPTSKAAGESELREPDGQSIMLDH